MKFIYVGEVTDQLLARPELLEDRYVTLVLRMMALDAYVREATRPIDERNVENMERWLEVAEGGMPSANISEYALSLFYDILLAYVILKYADPLAPWSIHVGTYEAPGFGLDLWYLQAVPSSNTEDIATFVGDVPVDQVTIITGIEEEDLKNGSFVMYDNPICAGSELLKYEAIYRNGVGKDSVPLPSSKGEIMKWLRSERMADDDNVKDISSAIDILLSPGSDFANIIHDMNLWNERTIQPDIYNTILVRSIMKVKITKGINIIFEKYPPKGCVVPADVFEI